jgi:hypothetical protein
LALFWPYETARDVTGFRAFIAALGATPNLAFDGGSMWHTSVPEPMRQASGLRLVG